MALMWEMKNIKNRCIAFGYIRVLSSARIQRSAHRSTEHDPDLRLFHFTALSSFVVSLYFAASTRALCLYNSTTLFAYKHETLNHWQLFTSESASAILLSICQDEFGKRIILAVLHSVVLMFVCQHQSHPPIFTLLLYLFGVCSSVLNAIRSICLTLSSSLSCICSFVQCCADVIVFETNFTFSYVFQSIALSQNRQLASSFIETQAMFRLSCIVA